jgi:hypothetical protein
MPRILVLLLALALSACAFPKHTAQKPFLFIRLSTADQVCLKPKQESTPVVVYVTLLNFQQPLPEVRIVHEPGGFEVSLQGETVTWNLERVGLGAHLLTVSAGPAKAEKFFSVWTCDAGVLS